MNDYDGSLESTRTKVQRTINADRITTQKNPDGTTTMWNQGRVSCIRSGEPYRETAVVLFFEEVVKMSRQEAEAHQVQPLEINNDAHVDGSSRA